MLIKYTFGSKSQTLRMRYPFQSTGRPISHRNGCSFRVYMIPLRDFVPEWNSRPSARTGVNSRRGDSRRHNILWWYRVNKYRAMRGNRSELGPERKPEWTRPGVKVAPVSCKHPLTAIIYHHIEDINLWSSSILNNVLVTGNNSYSTLRSIVRTNGYLLLTDVPAFVSIFDNVYTVHYNTASH